MKKTCNGCKALVHSSNSKTGGMQCSLNYKTKNGKELFGITVETIPLEDCPKPKNNTDYIYLSNLKTNYLTNN